MAPVGRRHHIVVDCADPLQEATFWSAVLGEPITHQDADYVVVALSDRHSGLTFQLAPGHVATRRPAGDGDQQLHLDVMVDDLAAASAAVQALGARPLGGGHVYADPAGHPFCLIRRPRVGAAGLALTGRSSDPNGLSSDPVSHFGACTARFSDVRTTSTGPAPRWTVPAAC